jgi:flagellar biosynthesis protein FlhF
MATKTFKGETLIEVFQRVKADLGDDAIVVSVRKVLSGPAWQVWRKPNFEVVATSALGKSETKPARHSDLAVIPQMKSPKNEKPVMLPETPSNVQNTEAFSIPVVKRQSIPGTTPVNRYRQELRVAENMASQTNLPKSEALSPQEPLVDDRKAQMIAQLVREHSRRALEEQLNVQSNSESPVIPQKLEKPIELVETLKTLQTLMIQQGVDSLYLDKALQDTQIALPPGTLRDLQKVKKFLKKVLGNGIRVQSEAALENYPAIFLAGPTGAGKTSLMAKLAVRFRQTTNKKIHWVCADTVRVGAIAEAQMYADMLGVDLHIVYTPDELSKIIAQKNDEDLFLIDSTGINPYKESKVVQLAAFITSVPNRWLTVVVPSNIKYQDMLQLYASLDPMRIKSFVFTKMDETQSYGPAYNLIRKSQLPMMYFTTGTQLMTDLHPADSRELIDSLFGEGMLTR